MNAALFDAAAAALPSLCFDKPPACGLILGSGWGQALQTGEPLLRMPYADIPGLGASTVVGHIGELLLFERHGLRIAAFVGRRHWYEGAGWGRSCCRSSCCAAWGRGRCWSPTPQEALAPA